MRLFTQDTNYNGTYMLYWGLLFLLLTVLTYTCVSLHAGEGVWGHPLHPLPGPPAQAHGAGAVP